MLWRLAASTALVMLTITLTAGAAFAADFPNSGSLLDQVNQSQPPPPEKQPDDVKVVEAKPVTPLGDLDQVKIRVNRFFIMGETVLPETELLSQLNDQTGRDLSLGELYGLADRITQYLRKRGYLVAFAYIPAQRIEDGAVGIAVMPGRYGTARINNEAGIHTDRLEKMVAALKPGSVITRGPLERVLLLLNDLAGVNIKATLAAGEYPGTSDLILDVENAQKLTGAFNGDNSGNDSTGRNLGGIQLNIHNLTHTGDTLTLSGLGAGSGLKNEGLSYLIPLGSRGLRLGIDYSRVRYELGGEFSELDATGYARVLGCELTYPFIRGRASNLYGILGFDHKTLNDEIGSGDFYMPRTGNIWKMGIRGDMVDAWGGGGSNRYGSLISFGDLTINDDIAAALDAATTESAGRFLKMNLNYNRLQYVAPSLMLDFRISGQLANANLDSSEKFFLGGADGVRAYAHGARSGDQGMLFSTELRWRLPNAHLGRNALYLTNFLDYGNVTINHDPWPGAGDNHASLKGAGVGFIWEYANLMFRCDYAKGIGDDGDSDDDSHLWLRLVAYF